MKYLLLFVIAAMALPGIALAETVTLTQREGSQWATYVAVDVPGGLYSKVPRPTCSNDISRAKAALTNAVANYVARVAVEAYAGPFSDVIEVFIPDIDVRGFIGEWLNPTQGEDATCALVAVVIPAHAFNVSAIPQGADNYNYENCDWGDHDCTKYARWGPYQSAASGAGAVISAEFLNWSQNVKQARIKILYDMPPGEVPQPTR